MTEVTELPSPRAPFIQAPLVRALPEPDMALAADPDYQPARPLGPRPERGGPRSTDVERQLRERAQTVLRLVLEVVAGRRPPVQLKGMVSAPVLRYVRAAAGQGATRERWARPAAVRPRPPEARVRRGVGGPGLRTMRICRPDDDVAEVSVVWQLRGRYRAAAARFEMVTSATGTRQWRCTELRLG